MGKMRSLWRYYLVGAAISVSFASIATCFFTILHYETSWPRKPEPERGFVYPMAGKGYTYYISAQESAGEALLFGSGMISIIVIFVAMPREIFRMPHVSAGQSRHAARARAWADRDRAIKNLLTSNPSIGTVSFIALVIYSAAIYFVGPPMARLAASYGVGF
jgi:hypothetical protein